jgi:hypothetical protein
MGLNFKFVWALGGICLVSALFAGEKESIYASPSPSFGKAQLSDLTKRVEAAEQKTNQISELKTSKELGIKNPYAMGCMTGREGIFTQLSFLYWRPNTEGFAYAREFVETTPIEVAKVRYVKFHGRPGLRVALGYTTGYDGWSLEGLYTWARFTAHRFGISGNFTRTGDFGFLPQIPFFFVTQENIGLFQTAGAHWRMNYNTGDFQFSRGFFITKALTLQPLFGARVGCLNQKAKSFFIQNQDYYVDNENPYSRKYVSHVKFWGVGPRIGVDGKWNLPKNFGVTGLVAGSLLYGKVKRLLLWFEPQFQSMAKFEETGKSFVSYHSFVPNMQLALGLDWGLSFHKEKMYWGMNLGWEFNYWWQPFPFDAEGDFPQPFEIQGLTLRTDFHF